MTNPKTPFVALVKDGLSFVICPQPRVQKMRDIEAALADRKIACASTRWLKTEDIINLTNAWLRARARDEIEGRALVVLTQAPLLSHGFRLPFHRIVWMDSKPATTHPSYAVYQQTCQRGGKGVAVVHHTGALT